MTKRAIKSVIAVALLGALLYRADMGQALQQLVRLSPQTFLGSLALLVLGLVMSTWKWSFALRMQELFYPFGLLLRILCIGFFFNSFLPTAVGGDAYRVYRTLPRDRYRSRALAAVAIERATGLMALLVLGGVGAAILTDQFAAARLYCAVLLAVTTTFVAGLLVIRHRWLSNLIDRWRHIATVDAILHSMGRLRNQRANWLPLLALSFTFQAISIGVVFLLFRDISAPVTLAQCALITAIVGAAAVIPVSINGIGVMEGAFVGASIALGLNYEQALIVAFARRFIAVILSAACAAVYLMELQRPNAAGGGWTFSSFLHALRSRHSEPVPQLAEPDVPLGNFAAETSAHRDWGHSELLEYTHDAIIIWEMDGDGIVYWNRAAEYLYGYARTEALGKTTHALLKTQLAGGVDRLQSAIARHGVWIGELRHTTRDGREVEVQGRLALMSQHNGRWLVLEVNRDITDRKKAEAAQKAMAQQLTDLRARVQLRD